MLSGIGVFGLVLLERFPKLWSFPLGEYHQRYFRWFGDLPNYHRKAQMRQWKERCTSSANGDVSIAHLKGTRWRLADSSEVVMKSVRTKQTLSCCVPWNKFGSSLPFKFLYSVLHLCQVWSLLWSTAPHIAEDWNLCIIDCHCIQFISFIDLFIIL